MTAIDLKTDRPHPARVYDYLLGGSDNFAADREAAEAGMRQFLDIGTGLPTSPNVHEVAQSVAPDARVAYVDNDPIVLAHARALLTGSPRGRTSYFDQPVGLLLIAIMHFVGDEDQPFDIARRLLDALPSGSYLALSHLTGDFDPEAWAGVIAVYAKSGVTMQVRSKPEIERFFDGLDLVEPGVQSLPAWRPDGDREDPRPTDAQVSVYGGVARKP